VLEKDVEDLLDRPCEKYRNITTYDPGGMEQQKSHCKEESLIELFTSDVGTAFQKHVTEEMVEGAGRQRRRRKQLPDDLKETKSYW
jgi:hypothetical protein